MSSIIIEPQLTDQIVLEVFKLLVQFEVRKHLPSQGNFRHGQQEGVVAAIAMLFGDNNNADAEEAFDSGRTWLHVKGEIIEDTKLRNWILLFESEGAHDWDDEELQQDVENAVNNYALRNPKKIGDALRINL